MTKAPVALFVYNRPLHTAVTLLSLSECKEAAESSLYIFADGPKAGATEEDRKLIEEVRSLIREKKWCGEVQVIESTVNKGLANSIISGVTSLVNKFGRLI